MDCRKFHKNLEDYLEGGLDFPGRFGMERHAEQCLPCGKEVAVAQRLKGIAGGLAKIRAPHDFEAALLRRLQAEVTRSWYQRLWIYGLDLPHWRQWAIGAAGLALVGFGVLFFSGRLLKNGGEPDVRGYVGERTMGAEPAVRQLAGSSGPGIVPAADHSAGQPSRLAADDPWRTESDPLSQDYFEYTVPGPDGRPYLMRLPKTIRMQFGQPSEDHFIRNVSH